MSRFTVEPTPRAEGQLASAWLAAIDRSALTRAAAEIDRLLAADPLKNGTELSEGLYRIVEGQLVAYYEIDVDRSRVIITKFALR